MEELYEQLKEIKELYEYEIRQCTKRLKMADEGIIHLSEGQIDHEMGMRNDFEIKAWELDRVLGLIERDYMIPDSGTSLTMTHPGTKVNYEIK